MDVQFSGIIFDDTVRQQELQNSRCNGIDYIEVDTTPGVTNQRLLRLYFIPPGPDAERLTQREVGHVRRAVQEAAGNERHHRHQHGDVLADDCPPHRREKGGHPDEPVSHHPREDRLEVSLDAADVLIAHLRLSDLAEQFVELGAVAV